jgi:pimeloyl-ACP methyl ester carboxylesterase
MPYITTEDDVDIYFRDWGTGTPVVLIHGWPLNGDMWERQANFLVENGYRVITYDRRGFGRSEQPSDGYDYDTLAADLNELIEELDLQEAVLVGFSMGGGEVIRYLSNFGAKRVSKAVLVSAIPPYLLKTADNPEGVDPEVFDKIGQQLREDRADFLKSFGPKFYGRGVLNHTVSEAVLEWTLSIAFTSTLRPTLATAVSWSTTDFREEMRGVQVPVLIIQGTGDSTVPIDASGRRSVQILPNADIIEYEDEPHGLFITASDRLNSDLLEFLGGTPLVTNEAYIEEPLDQYDPSALSTVQVEEGTLRPE